METSDEQSANGNKNKKEKPINKIRILLLDSTPSKKSLMKIRKNKMNIPTKVVLNRVEISSKREEANQVRYIPKKVKIISQ